MSREESVALAIGIVLLVVVVIQGSILEYRNDRLDEASALIAEQAETITQKNAEIDQLRNLNELCATTLQMVLDQLDRCMLAFDQCVPSPEALSVDEQYAQTAQSYAYYWREQYLLCYCEAHSSEECDWLCEFYIEAGQALPAFCEED